MSKVILAVGPNRSGKTYQGRRWVAAAPHARVRFEYGTPNQLRSIRSLVADGKDVWVEVAPGIHGRMLDELADLADIAEVEVRKMTYQQPPPPGGIFIR